MLLRVVVRCVFPTGENKDCGDEGVGGGGVSLADGVFYGTAHSFVILFRIINIGAVPSMWGIAALVPLDEKTTASR
jgi:hypothetical protein